MPQAYAPTRYKHSHKDNTFYETFLLSGKLPLSLN
uniref:Uncharacterized protein n=1 Tax=Arundo donax TaxID=35708 RepID=A0A0A9H674_ARUDO